MEPASPAPDEPVIGTFDRIIVCGARHELVLTDRRVILTETGTGRVRREAEYPRIVLANLGVNNLREPEISLSFAMESGEPETEDIYFVHLPAGQNVQAADKCMDLLKDKGVPVRRSATMTQMGPPSRAGTFTPSDKISAGRPAVPDFSPFGPTMAGTGLPAEGPKGILSSPLVIGGLALAVIIMIVVLASMGGLPGSQKSPPATPVVTPAMTVATTAPTPVATPVITAEPGPQTPVTPAPPLIPENGIWLYVSSPSNYIGGIKAQGWRSEINATGTFLTQIASQNTLIEGSVEKTDGTGNPLAVKLYNGGEPVFEESLTKRYGMIQIRQEVGPAVLKNPSATPVPTIILKPVPSPGVFVRVSYDGEFSGTIYGNGLEQRVIGSGDQFYQISLLDGQIDGFFEKQDGSGRNLVVQVYRDGNLLQAFNTSRPYGEVEFHVTI
jgi:hypothetical protein